MAKGGASVTRREALDEKIVLAVLDAIERDPAVTQRSVALKLGVALGLVNAYVKRCIRKGFVKVRQVPPRRYAYFLTPHGISEKSRLTATYLTSSFAFFRRSRLECSELFLVAAGRGQRRFALIGGGDLSEIAGLAAREHSVEIAGVVSSHSATDGLRAGVLALGVVDAVMVTSLQNPREAFVAAVAAFGPERVYAPALLGIQPVVTAQVGERS